MNEDKNYFLNNLWRWKCYLPEVAPKGLVTLKELRQTEWSPEFERLMRNRLVMGALRYGRLGASGKPQYARMGSVRKRLSTYLKTGNLELLVDAANLILCEYVECEHPLRHFESIDDGEHVKTI